MIKKSFTATSIILLLVISISSTMQVEVLEANPLTYSPPAPAIPEFTLKYADNSYIAAGNFVQNKSIEVTIKNQPTAYVLCYNVNSKSHLSENWTSYEYYNNSSYLTSNLFIPNRLQAWNSTFTVLVFGFEGNNGSETYNLMLGKDSVGDQIDFQVQAYIGNWFPGKAVNATASVEYYLLNIDAVGDWSPTQTITVPASPIAEFPAALALTTLVLLALAVLVSFKRMKKHGQS